MGKADNQLLDALHKMIAGSGGEVHGASQADWQELNSAGNLAVALQKTLATMQATAKRMSAKRAVTLPS